jgi:pyruvate formate lyase activating enzyme
VNRTSRSRRDFLKLASRWSVILGGAGLLRSTLPFDELMALGVLGPAGVSLKDLVRRAPAARYWTSTTQKDADCVACHAPGALKGATSHRHKRAVVKCQLCAHGCVIEDGDRGRCHARINIKGELKSLVYGRPITEHVDPIEKKPFYHFLPGSDAYSLATSGCPLRCKFCQNWQISQASPEDYTVAFTSPETIAGRAGQRRTRVIAFTYNEPTVFTEYLTDIARAARKSGIRTVLVSCGFMNEAPLKEMIEVLDGIKIDLKGFSSEFYHDVSGAELAPVLRSIKQVATAGRHLEIVNLVVPTLNDSPKKLTELSKWVAGELGPDVPVHFTRFHPDYQLQNLPPTPVATLERAREAAMKQGIHYAYVGNVPGHPGNNTYCPSCGKICIERSSFFVVSVTMKNGKCSSCGTRIAGVWS